MKRFFSLDSLFLSVIGLAFILWFFFGVAKINKNQLTQKQRYEQINKR